MAEARPPRKAFMRHGSGSAEEESGVAAGYSESEVAAAAAKARPRR